MGAVLEERGVRFESLRGVGLFGEERKKEEEKEKGKREKKKKSKRKK